MGMLENEPTDRLPEHLQTKHRELLAQKTTVLQEIKELGKEILDYRDRCKHEAIPGSEGHYATYCRKCGYMMDTWL